MIAKAVFRDRDCVMRDVVEIELDGPKLSSHWQERRDRRFSYIMGIPGWAQELQQKTQLGGTGWWSQEQRRGEEGEGKWTWRLAAPCLSQQQRPRDEPHAA